MPRAIRAATFRTVRDVAIGGALGALVRTAVVLGAVATVGDDLGAVVGLNLAGTYLLARLTVHARRDGVWHDRVPLVGTGVLGSLTTFSGLAVPVALLLGDGRPGAAIVWAGGNVAIGTWVAGRGLRRLQ